MWDPCGCSYPEKCGSRWFQLSKSVPCQLLGRQFWIETQKIGAHTRYLPDHTKEAVSAPRRPILQCLICRSDVLETVSVSNTLHCRPVAS